jgi:hypothetical protein
MGGHAHFEMTGHLPEMGGHDGLKYAIWRAPLRIISSRPKGIGKTLEAGFLVLFSMVVECSFDESLIWVIVFSTKTSTAFTDWVYTQVLTLTLLCAHALSLIKVHTSIKSGIPTFDKNYCQIKSELVQFTKCVIQISN